MIAHARVQRRTRLDEYRDVDDISAFAAAVSLHAHTSYSRESTSDVPEYMRLIPLLGRSLERELRGCLERDGEALDFSKMWWHPPMTPRSVFDSECGQIEGRLGLPALVSVTDHDDIRAGVDLQRLYAERRTPISFEWTVPFENSFFHLGIHNLPPASAAAWFERLAGVTARNDHRAAADALRDLHAIDDVLIVMNHPQWDLAGVGPRIHARLLRDFLCRHRPSLHALELNGYRAWSENQRVWPLATALNLPLISGGDRHGAAPNALLNLTRADTFAGFVREVRQGLSHIVVMPEYRTHLVARVVGSVSDVLRPQPSNTGSRHPWTDRVSLGAEGNERTLSSHWPTGGPLWVRSAIAVFTTLAGASGLRILGVTLAAAERLASREVFRWSPRGRPGIGPIGVDAN